ncbi:hypothetical protein AMATHDRAFT_85848, partial [Amanita thiersii Skay4041]
MSYSVISTVSVTNTGQKDLVFQYGDSSVEVPVDTNNKALEGLTMPYEVYVKGSLVIIATIRYIDNKSLRVKRRAIVDGASFICQAVVSQLSQNKIVAPIPISHAVDSSGTLTLNVPLQLPHSRFMPEISLGYNSAVTRSSVLGCGWDLIGVPTIERVPATIAQDGHRGTVKDNQYDCFALSGQRLIKISGSINNRTKYRLEIEQWSRFFALGDVANPTSWEQYLPDGTIRKFGDTTDSNITALTGKSSPPTRVWAVSQFIDPFSNYVSFKYLNNSTTTGAFYLQMITYGDNSTKATPMQFQVSFSYEQRRDITKRYLGGYPIQSDQRMSAIKTTLYTKQGPVTNDILQYALKYAETDIYYQPSCLQSVVLTDLITGAATDPLTFDWLSSPVFPVIDQPKPTVTLAGTSVNPATDFIIPLDVNGNARNDIVIASNKNNQLSLDVYFANLDGTVSGTKTTGSVSTTLTFSPLLYPLDSSGDGLADLLHILLDSGKFTITALLSKPDRTKPDTVNFQQQKLIDFTPPKTPVEGEYRFYTGDFSGTGCVGLVYIYKDTDNQGNPIINFVQFVSNGTALSILPTQTTPASGWDFTKMQMVVGDLEGSGAGTDWRFLWAKSIDGKLQCQQQNFSHASDLSTASDAVILPFNADNDSKTGILFALNNKVKVRLRLLRSAGIGFIREDAFDTGVDYSGNITINRIVSPNTLDVVIDSSSANGTGRALYVVHFDSQRFSAVTTIDILNTDLVRWADLRGIGRSDCTRFTFSNGAVTFEPRLCSGSKRFADHWQPLNYISGYSQGLGFVYNAMYAPLSDPGVYPISDSIPVPLVNAFSGNAGCAGHLGGDQSAQIMCSTRVQLVTFPRFVVYLQSERVDSSPDNTHQYGYTNALVDFSGRGWLGFQTVTKRSLRLRMAVTTTYKQSFPFIGLASMIVKKNDMTAPAPSSILQINRHQWKDSSSQKKLYLPRLATIYEQHFQDDKLTFNVDVEFDYDRYGNTTKTQIAVPQSSSLLSINSTFQDPTVGPPSPQCNWVVGSKLSETVSDKSATVLKNTTYTYYPGTSCCTETKNWVDDKTWISTNYTYNNYGNTASVKGPDRSQKFDFDTMVMSNVVKTRTYTSLQTFSDETANYKDPLNLALGLPSSTTDSNGLISSYDYDVLGRKVGTSRGTAPNQMTGIEKVSFAALPDGISETRYISNGLKGKRATNGEMGNPSHDLSRFIYNDTEYDEIGRVTARSRPYLDGQTPTWITYCYDILSRLTRVVYPPAETGGSSVTRSITYKFQGGSAVIRETVADGTTTRFTASRMNVLPNADAAGQFVKFCAVKQRTEIGQTTTAEFDGLCRPITILDPRGVRLSLTYDRLSRVTNRRITSGTGSAPKLTSDITMSFNDALWVSTLRNTIATTTVVSTKDYLGRLIKKVTQEDTLDYKYSNDHLSSVSSDIGPSYAYAYAYDDFGNLKSTAMTLGSDKFKTSFAYTNMGQLLNTTNQDGSSITRTLYSDGTRFKTCSSKMLPAI